MIAAPPSRVLMTYTDPERRTIAIDGKSLIVVWPDRREREKIDISQTQKRIDQYFTQATIGQLRSMFEITAKPDSVIREADRVDMRPKRKQIKEGLERLELWIDRESLLLVQMRMTFPGGDARRSGSTTSRSTCRSATRRFRSAPNRPLIGERLGAGADWKAAGGRLGQEVLPEVRRRGASCAASGAACA